MITTAYVLSNGTQTDGMVIDVKDTRSTLNDVRVYKVTVQFETSGGEVLTASVKMPLTIYTAVRVGNTIPITYSNLTPNVIIPVGLN